MNPDRPHHPAPEGASQSRLAISATVHCLTGCGIGEVLGMVIGNTLQWTNVATISSVAYSMLRRPASSLARA